MEIRCDTKNIKSKMIPERLKFDLEGVIRNEDLSVDGSELRDTNIYAKVKQSSCTDSTNGTRLFNMKSVRGCRHKSAALFK
ncbi:hypothetical protein D3C73_1332960 [compost metagenome]